MGRIIQLSHSGKIFSENKEVSCCLKVGNLEASEHSCSCMRCWVFRSRFKVSSVFELDDIFHYAEHVEIPQLFQVPSLETWKNPVTRSCLYIFLGFSSAPDLRFLCLSIREAKTKVKPYSNAHDQKEIAPGRCTEFA